jgi:hypothetical protein
MSYAMNYSPSHTNQIFLPLPKPLKKKVELLETNIDRHQRLYSQLIAMGINKDRNRTSHQRNKSTNHEVALINTYKPRINKYDELFFNNVKGSIRDYIDLLLSKCSFRGLKIRRVSVKLKDTHNNCRSPLLLRYDYKLEVMRKS